jgi:hypothetical protein
MKEVVQHLEKDDRFSDIRQEEDRIQFKYKGRVYSIFAEREVYILCWVDRPVFYSSQLEEITDFTLI